jgi:menaquinone-specific isochorismate synthase
MRSLAPRSIGSIDVTPIHEAIAQTLSLAQHRHQPVILTYSWNYAEFSQGQSALNQITPASLLANASDSEYKFYWQQQLLTLAAIGVVAHINTDINSDHDSEPIDPNQNRFETAKLFCQKYLTHSVTKGDTDLGQIPTYALGGFAFHAQVLTSQDSWQGFPNGMLFIPKWLLLQDRNSPLVIALNYCIHPEDHLSELEQEVADRILEFPHLSSELSISRELNPNSDQDIEEVTGDRPWTEIVEQALQLIKWGKLEKIVLARALDVFLTCPHLEVLSSLRHNYPDCISFLLNFGVGSFVGATPEILLQFEMNELGDDQGLHLKSDAIAGSTRRGLSAAEDQLLGNILLASLKDRYEHEIVITSICDRLQALGVDLQDLTSPKLKRLKNVQHLHTEIKGILNGGHWLQSFEILRQLHPTAAVGGEPQEIAVQLIQASEACDRGWYAAPIGWVNSKGEGIFAVGIRSGYLNGDSARIYAGAGIVADSDIASELGETAIKFEALLKALGSFRL